MSDAYISFFVLVFVVGRKFGRAGFCVFFSSHYVGELRKNFLFPAFLSSLFSFFFDVHRMDLGRRNYAPIEVECIFFFF